MESYRQFLDFFGGTERYFTTEKIILKLLKKRHYTLLYDNTIKEQLDYEKLLKNDIARHVLPLEEEL